jgi:hypothetical protein
MRLRIRTLMIAVAVVGIGCAVLDNTEFTRILVQAGGFVLLITCGVLSAVSLINWLRRCPRQPDR